jgi:hypothetical protein
MATGRRPFDGNSSAELASAILRDTPPTVTDVRSDLPSDLARIIRRCLEKDPRYRCRRRATSATSFAIWRDRRHREWLPKRTHPLWRRQRQTHGSFGGVVGRRRDRLVALFLLKGHRPRIDAALCKADNDLRAIARELGARYVMDGSLRRAGTKLRLAVQLVDAVSGTHLWAENYDRASSPVDVFALQDDLVPRIVSTVADTQGVLPHSMSEALRGKNPDELSPYEAVLRSFAHFQRVNAEEHAAARAGLERAVQQAPAMPIAGPYCHC